MAFLLVSFLAEVLLVALSGAQDCECPASMCPDGWVTFQGSCYYVSDNVSTDWTEAAHHCSQHDNSHLVVIESKEEDLFIRSQLERLYRDPNHRVGEEFWIGATDEMVEGVWTWYKGDKHLTTTYTNWYPGQPGSDGADEDCAVIAVRDENGKEVYDGWHDAPCDRQHHPICEISSDVCDSPFFSGGSRVATDNCFHDNLSPASDTSLSLPSVQYYGSLSPAVFSSAVPQEPSFPDGPGLSGVRKHHAERTAWNHPRRCYDESPRPQKRKKLKKTAHPSVAQHKRCKVDPRPVSIKRKRSGSDIVSKSPETQWKRVKNTEPDLSASDHDETDSGVDANTGATNTSADLSISDHHADNDSGIDVNTGIAYNTDTSSETIVLDYNAADGSLTVDDNLESGYSECDPSPDEVLIHYNVDENSFVVINDGSQPNTSFSKSSDNGAVENYSSDNNSGSGSHCESCDSDATINYSLYYNNSVTSDSESSDNEFYDGDARGTYFIDNNSCSSDSDATGNYSRYNNSGSSDSDFSDSDATGKYSRYNNCGSSDSIYNKAAIGYSRLSNSSSSDSDSPYSDSSDSDYRPVSSYSDSSDTDSELRNIINSSVDVNNNGVGRKVVKPLYLKRRLRRIYWNGCVCCENCCNMYHWGVDTDREGRRRGGRV